MRTVAKNKCADADTELIRIRINAYENRKLIKSSRIIIRGQTLVRELSGNLLLLHCSRQSAASRDVKVVGLAHAKPPLNIPGYTNWVTNGHVIYNMRSCRYSLFDSCYRKILCATDPSHTHTYWNFARVRKCACDTLKQGGRTQRFPKVSLITRESSNVIHTFQISEMLSKMANR